MTDLREAYKIALEKAEAALIRAYTLAEERYQNISQLKAKAAELEGERSALRIQVIHLKEEVRKKQHIVDEWVNVDAKKVAEFEGNVKSVNIRLREIYYEVAECSPMLAKGNESPELIEWLRDEALKHRTRVAELVAELVAKHSWCPMCNSGEQSTTDAGETEGK